MSDIAPAYLPCRAGIGQFSVHTGNCPAKEGAMSNRDAGSERRGKLDLNGQREGLRRQNHLGLDRNGQEVPFAYAMSGSDMASLAIIAAPHLEVLLRCLFHARG
jgi:hypothetical protein